MLIFLFGLSGSGKNFVGELLEKEYGFYFWDADNFLSDEMKLCIQQKKIFTQVMRDNFTNTVISAIKKLLLTHEKVVIAQALYKEKNRKQILDAFPNAIFFWIDAPLNLLAERIKKRNNSVGADYAKEIAKNFEEPKITHYKISNKGSLEILKHQLEPKLGLKSETHFLTSKL